MVLAIGWALFSTGLALYHAIASGHIEPLITIAALAPLFLLTLHKLEVFTGRALRDNKYLKSKAFKTLNNTEKSFIAIKSIRTKNKTISARSREMLENLNLLRSGIDESLEQAKQLPRHTRAFVEQTSPKAAEETVAPSKNVSNPGIRLIEADHLSKLFHFGAFEHTELTPLQHTEISNILDKYNISNVVLVDIEELPLFNRVLSQTRVSSLQEVSTLSISLNEPILIVTKIDSLTRLTNYERTQLLHLNAAFVIPSPLSSNQLANIRFTRIPLSLAISSLEFICPEEFIGIVEPDATESTR